MTKRHVNSCRIIIYSFVACRSVLHQQREPYREVDYESGRLGGPTNPRRRTRESSRKNERLDEISMWQIDDDK